MCPENDAITLQIVTIKEAEHLFERFMTLVTNGAMYFDPLLHTLSFVRSRSSFLLASILAFASLFVEICPSSRLHTQLLAHAQRLECLVVQQHYKSIEIIQALCLLSSWTEVPSSLSKDKTWMYMSRAIAIATELRLDHSMPYCVWSDPLFTEDTRHILVRNAHRTWRLLFIHDRNMSMVAGRYPLLPESTLTTKTELERWGRHYASMLGPRFVLFLPQLATSWDGPICASVSLRKLAVSTRPTPLTAGRTGPGHFIRFRKTPIIDRSIHDRLERKMGGTDIK